MENRTDSSECAFFHEKDEVYRCCYQFSFPKQLLTKRFPNIFLKESYVSDSLVSQLKLKDYQFNSCLGTGLGKA